MNYYNPYIYTAPQALTTSRVGLLTRLFGNTGLSLSRIINGTQRVLTFANQAIPFVKQVRPMIGNAKTMFKVMNEFKRSETPIKNNNTNTNNSNNIEPEKTTTNNISYEYKNNEGPTFFI